MTQKTFEFKEENHFLGFTNPSNDIKLDIGGNKNLTAIEWLRKKLEVTYDKERKLPLAYTFSLLNKAEQMEKNQIIDAFNIACQDEDRIGEEYYYDTYGGQGSPDISPNTQNK